jgi:hypothetical protein
VQPLSWRKRLSLAVGRRSDACLQNGRSRFECCRRAITGPPCPRSRAGALRDRRRLHPQRLTEWFGRHRKAAGVTTGTLHILRHTHATLALTNGVPLHVVAARLSSPDDLAGVRPPAPALERRGSRTGRSTTRLVATNLVHEALRLIECLGVRLLRGMVGVHRALGLATTEQ